MENVTVVTIGQLIGVASVAVAIMAMFMGALLWVIGRQVDAKTKGTEDTVNANIEGVCKLLAAKVECIQASIATGTEEHGVWRGEISKTNGRLDDLMLLLVKQNGGRE